MVWSHWTLAGFRQPEFKFPLCCSPPSRPRLVSNPVPQSLPLQSETTNRNYLTGFLRELKKIMHVKILAQSLVVGTRSTNVNSYFIIIKCKLLMNSIKLISQLQFSEEKGNYSDISSRKIFNIQNQMCTKSVEGVDGWRLRRDHHWLSGDATSAVDIRKLLYTESETAGNDRKSPPMSQLLCTLETGYCQGTFWNPALLQKFVCQTLVSITATGGRITWSLCHPNTMSTWHWQNLHLIITVWKCNPCDTNNIQHKSFHNIISICKTS